MSVSVELSGLSAASTAAMLTSSLVKRQGGKSSMFSTLASTSSAVARENAKAAFHETREAPGTGILHGTLNCGSLGFDQTTMGPTT